MFVYTHFLRVRYAETDQMGVVYHGNYITYLEVARAEAIRSLGITYKEMELGGVAMPVVDVNIQYLKPAHYDEELRIVVTVKSFPDKRLCADYEIFNAHVSFSYENLEGTFWQIKYNFWLLYLCGKTVFTTLLSVFEAFPVASELPHPMMFTVTSSYFPISLLGCLGRQIGRML